MDLEKKNVIQIRLSQSGNLMLKLSKVERSLEKEVQVPPKTGRLLYDVNILITKEDIPEGLGISPP